MSTTIDQRVVEMRFDNKQFESNVQTSLGTISKLKQSLNLTGAAKGLENINSATRNFSMAGIGNAVESVQAKFSTLQVMAVTALANITNSAVNAGKRIVSALTIDPIKTGFQEYETQINAVQTILANTKSKGTTLTDVNGALDELNTYADKTIYNFTEMTRNIGTFTAAGVDLDTSVSSIKGIANLAAISGSSSQQASTAMYQLSQALAAGKVQLMDWNSVVNAGMGGQVFQDALKRTAKNMGYNVDEMIKKYGSFRESLTQGEWLTSEVLTETLSQLSGAYTEADLIAQGYTKEQAKEILELANTAEEAATKVKTFTQLFDTLKEAAQSGWTQTWEIIVGDFEEAKALLTEVSNVIGEIIGNSAKARNDLLQGWKDLGGRTAIIDGIKNAFEGVMAIIKPITKAFRQIFPRATAQQLYDISVKFRDLTAKFKEFATSWGAFDKITRTFKGLFSILGIGWELLKAVGKGFADLLGHILPAGNGILSFTANIGDYIYSLYEAVKSSNIFSKVIGDITNVVKKVIDGIVKFAKAVKDAFKSFIKVDTSGLDKFADNVKTRFEPLTKLGELVKKAFDGIVSVVKKVAPIFVKLGSLIAKGVGAIGKAIGDAFSSGNFNPIMDLFNTGIFAAILLGIRKFINSLSDVLDNGGGILGSVKDILDGVTGSLEAMQANLKSGVLLKIAGAMAILTAAIVALSLIDSAKLVSALTAMTIMLTELFASMAIFDKIMASSGFKGMAKVTTLMIGLSVAVVILTGAVANLSKLDWEGLAKGLVGVAALSAILVGVAKAMSDSSGKLIKGSAGLVIFTLAIRNLVKPVQELGAMNIETLAKGLVSVGVLMTELALFLKTTNFDGLSVGKGIGIIALATAINILGNAVSKFGGMDVNSLIKGLSAVGIVLAELAIFVNLTGNASKVTSTAIGLTILGGAMHIFAEAVRKMGGMSWTEIGKGLVTMAGSLALVTAAMNLLPKNMVSASVGMVGVASALVILANALNSMGGMSWTEIGKGLTVLAGSLTVMVAAMKLTTSALPGAAAMLVMASAIRIFTPAIQALGNMSLAEIGKSLLTLVGVFAVFGGAAALLSPLTPVMLALGAAITLFGAGCVAVGAGVLMFATALSALAVSGTAGAAALVLVVSSLVGLIPMILTQIGNGIIAFANVIASGAPAIIAAITTVITSLLTALTTAIPQFVNCLSVLLTSLLNFLVTSIPQLVNAGMQLILGLLQGVASKIGDIVTTAIQIVVNFINAIASKLPDIIQAGFNLIVSFFDGLATAIETNTPVLVNAILRCGKAIINGLVDGITGGVGLVIDAIVNVGKKLIQGFKSLLGINSPSKIFNNLGRFIIDGLVKGIGSKISNVISSVKQVASKAISALSGYISSFLNTGMKFINSLTTGIRNKISSAVSAAKSVVTNCVSAIGSFVSNFTSKGASLITGLVTGIRNKISSAVSVVKTGLSNCVSAIKGYVSNFASAGKEIINGFINGIQSKISSAAKKAAEMAKSALNSAKNALGIKSPSREFMEVGRFSVEGLSVGLQKFASVVGESASNLGNTAIEALKEPMSKIADIINGDIDINPTITPVLDLSNIEAGRSKLDAIFSRQQAMSISTRMNERANASVQNGVNTPANNNTFTFTQNNYSPKALSRLEIYRQTKNQISSMKEAVNAI